MEYLICPCSGRIISYGEPHDDDNGSSMNVGNQHSGVVSSVNNSFSWATLAKYQEDTLNKSQARKSFFKKPELHHTRTILDI